MAVVKYTALVAAVVGLSYLLLDRAGVIGAGSGEVAMVTIAGEKFSLEIAADSESITRGLMERTSIPDDGGMVFVFVPARVPGFWMKNCLVDIDLMYLDELGRILSMHQMVVEPPQGDAESDDEYKNRLPNYSITKLVSFAIELQAGSMERLGLTEGDTVEFDRRSLKRMAH